MQLWGKIRYRIGRVDLIKGYVYYLELSGTCLLQIEFLKLHSRKRNSYIGRKIEGRACTLTTDLSAFNDITLPHEFSFQAT
jgi:hypothetical protein